ncbi:unnamed protein product [Ixodes persulcatus]
MIVIQDSFIKRFRSSFSDKTTVVESQLGRQLLHSTTCFDTSE